VSFAAQRGEGHCKDTNLLNVALVALFWKAAYF
jgi:hypothetical protein